MGKTNWFVGFGGLAAVLAVWSRYQLERERNEYDRQIYFDTPYPVVGEEFPLCDYPRVWRNGMAYPEGFCGDDSCQSQFIKRAREKWSGRRVRVTKNNGTFEDQVREIVDFVSNPKYNKESVHFLQQLDDEDGYSNFFQFNTDDKLNYFKAAAQSPTHEYQGSQLFIGRGARTGTPMHFAIAVNYFAMVAGRKRWILVDPAYLDDVECKVAQPGHFGVCDLTVFDTENITMDEQVELLKQAGVPEGAGYLDVTLEAGDVLQVCETWPHAIENLDDLNVGIALRAAASPFPMRLSLFTTMARMFGQGIIDYIQDPYRPGTRMVKMFLRIITGTAHGSLDTDPDESMENGTNVYNNMKTFNNRGVRRSDKMNFEKSRIAHDSTKREDDDV